MDHQYRIIAAGAGSIDRSPRGMLRFAGPDARQFLQALLTNDVNRLLPGGGLYACYLTPQGRLIGDLDLFRRGDVMLASVAPRLAAPLAARLDALIFSEDMTVSDVSAEWTEIGVTGGAVAALLGRALDVGIGALDSLSEHAHVDWRAGFVARAGRLHAADVPSLRAGGRPRGCRRSSRGCRDRADDKRPGDSTAYRGRTGSLGSRCLLAAT